MIDGTNDTEDRVIARLRAVWRGNVGRLVSRSWEMAWPMTLIMFFDFLIGLTDVFVAGKVGKDVQAAYGFVIQVYFIFIVIANALTVGTVSVVSRLFSAGDRNELSTAVFSIMVTAAWAGVVLAVFGIVLAPLLIEALPIPSQVKPFCAPLVRIYSAGLLFQYLLIVLNGILRSCGMIKNSLRTMTVVCLLNVGLNILLVFYTPLSYRGIALSTATSVFVGSIINLGYVRKLMTGVRLFSRSVITRIAKIGWPMAATQVLWQFGGTALFLILGKLPENRVEIMAAFTAGLRIESVVFLPAFAFNMANAVIVGNLLGEKKRDEAYRSGLVTALVGVCLIAALVLAVIVNARWIASFLSSDPVVAKETTKYVYIALISEPFMAWGIILGGGLSGAGDTTSVMLRVAGSVWLVRIPLAFLFVVVLGFGAVSVWWSMNISQFVQCYLLYRRYSQRKWLAASDGA